jgi:non-ribosomal peptide synthase protein (TIGR01720 family)
LLLIHQLAVDETSWRIVLEDLLTLDRQIAGGDLPLLPAKTASFRSWSERVGALFETSDLEAEATYWLTDNGPVATRLPLDFGHDHEPGQWAQASFVTRTVDEDHSAALLDEATRAYNTGVDGVLLTALARTLMDWTDSDHLRLDVEGQAREGVVEGVDLSRTVGWFGSLFPVTLRLDGDAEPGPALKSVKEQLRAVPRRGMAYGLLRYLRPESALCEQLRGLPQAEVYFAYRGRVDPVAGASMGWTLDAETVMECQARTGVRSHLLQIEGWVVKDQLRLRWTYNPGRHRRSTIEALAERFDTTLRALIDHCVSPQAQGYTPSDFPLADLDQRALDQLVIQIEEGLD